MAILSNAQNTSYAVWAPDQQTAQQYAQMLSQKYNAPYSFSQNSTGGFSVQPQYEGENGQPLTQRQYQAQYPTQSSGMNDQQFQQLIQSIKPAPQTPINIDWSKLQVPSIDQFIEQAKKDPELVKYYQSLLDQAKGDVNQAITRLHQDYDTGVRRFGEDISQQRQRVQEDLASALQTLGITFGKEKESLLDTLNKRGIALTQGGTGQPLTVAGEGRAGFEMGQLSLEQKLRKEAEERSAGRSMADITRQAQRFGEDQPLALKRGEEDIQRQAQQTKQQITGEQMRDTAQRAQILQAQAAAEAQMNLQRQILSQQGQQLGVGGGSRALMNPDGSDTRLGQLTKIGSGRNPIEEEEFRRLSRGG